MAPPRFVSLFAPTPFSGRAPHPPPSSSSDMPAAPSSACTAPMMRSISATRGTCSPTCVTPSSASRAPPACPCPSSPGWTRRKRRTARWAAPVGMRGGGRLNDGKRIIKGSGQKEGINLTHRAGDEWLHARAHALRAHAARHGAVGEPRVAVVAGGEQMVVQKVPKMCSFRRDALVARGPSENIH